MPSISLAVIAILLALAYAVLTVIGALTRDWLRAGDAVVLAAFWLLMWHQIRRKRKRRSLKALGRKARAKLAAMTRNMPKPVPQGAPS